MRNEKALGDIIGVDFVMLEYQEAKLVWLERIRLLQVQKIAKGTNKAS